MANTFEMLSNTQQSLVQSYMDAHRPLLGQISKMMNLILKVNDAYETMANASLQLMDANSTVNTTTGLSGAQSLMRSEVVAQVTNLKSMLVQFFQASDRQTYIKVAGLNNTL